MNKAWTIASLDTCYLTLYDPTFLTHGNNYLDKGVMSIYMSVERDSHIFNYNDNDLISYLLIDLKKYFSDIEENIIGFDIKRFNEAFPIFHPNYSEIIDTFNDNEFIKKGIVLAGDYTVFPTFDGAVKSAINAFRKTESYLTKSV